MNPASVLPGQRDKQRFVQEMFDRIAPRYGLVNSVMTFGLDRRWRRLAVRSLGLPVGSRVLDLASGPGEICDVLGTWEYRAIGMDLSWGMLVARGQGSGQDRVQGDAGYLPFASAAFDGITCGFGLRNFVDPATVFAEAGRVLRPGGRLAFLEVSVPRSRVLRAGHGLYFRHLVPRIGALLSDGTAYRYLPESVAYLPSSDEIADLLDRAGFVSVAIRQLAGGATQLVCGTRRS